MSDQAAELGAVERVRLPPSSVDSGDDGWWDGYRRSLGLSSLSAVAVQAIEADSRYILSKGIFGADSPDAGVWPPSRVRRGLVMGSVQSGKTASMIGVAAMGLDAGIGAVVVLGGTRLALWRQSLGRIRDQLDSTGRPKTSRIFLPPVGLAFDDRERSLPGLYSLNAAQARRAVRRDRPLVVIAMKNAHHLRALADMFRDSLVPALAEADRPFHMLVLDDEADDGSILDAHVESGLDPATADLKQVPRAIVDLWERRPHVGSTAAPNLFVSYVGYTATPQANLLQVDHNPLAPRDFVITLRVPLDTGAVRSRETTYAEPRGLDVFYTGGEAFYRRVPSLCVEPSTDATEQLADPIRAFLVAGAIRLWSRGERVLPSHAAGRVFLTKDEASTASPLPHSMLINPSPGIADHFDAAADVLMWAGDLDRDASRALIDAGERRLPGTELSRRVLDEGELWSRWIGAYGTTAELVRQAFDLLRSPTVPSDDDWPEIRRLLLDEVIPSTSISVVNSDPAADDRPEFDPRPDVDGGWRAPRDLSTIFVSGNVMSRGLTLEGLTTTLFLRRSEDPYADTQMQMQRWFGYRGSYLHLCRVFVPGPQLNLLRAYHEADEALRRDVLAEMGDGSGPAPRPLVLQGRAFSATGKITNVANVPLCPGATPFVRMLNEGRVADPNVRLLVERFMGGPSSDVVVQGRLRGRVLNRPLDLLEAAGLLDGLRYADYRPRRDGWQASRWSALEAHVGIDTSGDGEEGVPFYRPPDDADSSPSAERSDCPHAIGAYLRLWHACLTRRARGLVMTDDPDQPWSFADLSTKQREQPVFYVGIRYGSGSVVGIDGLEALPFSVRAMRRDTDEEGLVATWGSRNPGAGDDAYLGDALFDYHVHGRIPPGRDADQSTRWRPPGSPGLILFHVIEREGRPHPAATVGLAIPLGGPDQFAARTPDQV